MCGIFGVINDKNNNASQTVLSGLKSLEYRGYDSWGLVIKNNHQFYLEKRIGKIGEAKIKKINSTSGIGHTRWATHGGVTEANSHPHFDCQKKIFIVHNGIIENFLTFKEKLTKSGHHFSSETDSEVLAHLLEEEKEINPKIILNIFKELKGLNAFIIYLPKTEEIFAIKNSSPLVFGFDEENQQYFIASDYAAILSHTEKLYFLEDNELLYLSPKKFQLYDKNLKAKKIKFIVWQQKNVSLTLGKYPHYMIKEISEQPQVLKNIILEKDQITNIAQMIKKSYGNYLIGCGTSYYASLAATYLFSQIANRHTNACVASEFSYLTNFLTPKSLVIALSQSGETIDIISAVNKVKEKKAKVVAITNVLGSTLYRQADYKILLNAGPEKCVLATKSFTAKLAIIYLLSHSLINKITLGINQLNLAIAETERIIQQTQNQIKNLAKKLKNYQHIFILGRGISYPLSLEAALKIKESSYIHAEGFAGGELKHGVIALIEKGTPVIIYNPEDETYEDTLSSAYEIKARGGYLIGITSKQNKVYDDIIEVKNCHLATIIPNVVVAQLFGYYLTLEKNLDPDKPRNLAKSVTVK